MVGTLQITPTSPCREFQLTVGDRIYSGYEVDGETIYNIGGGLKEGEDGTSWLILEWVTLDDDQISTRHSLSYHFSSSDEQNKVIDFYARNHAALIRAVIHGLDTDSFMTLAAL